MKKVDLIHDCGSRLVIMSMLALFAFTGCSAHPSPTPPASSSSAPIQFQTDSVMRTAMGDSIYKIITEAKKIKAEEIVMTNDTAHVIKPTVVDVKSKFVPVLQFVLSNPKIYGGDTAMFGQFMPCFKLTFIKKKETCYLNFDFGLKKWNVCDSTGKQIKMFDLSSDDILRIANMLFSENDLYKNLINTDKR